VLCSGVGACTAPGSGTALCALLHIDIRMITRDQDAGQVGCCARSMAGGAPEPAACTR